MKRTLPIATVLIGLVFFSACQDPSNVGLGLIDEEITPTVETLPLSSLDPVNEADRTGNTDRVLAGHVEDPVLGTIEATGYINFARPDQEHELTAPVDSVILQLTFDYAFGDTTETMQLGLYEIATDERWSGAGAPADTTLPLGDEITPFEIAPEDTTKRVALPASWVEDNEDLLLGQSDEFNELFNGFALVADGPGMLIRGFDRFAASVIVYADGNAVTASGADVISRLQRTSPPNLPGDVILYQDGVIPDPDGAVPSASRLRVAFDVSEFENLSVNGARLEFHFDHSPFEGTPEEFYRPEPTELRVIGVDEEGEIVFEGDAPLLSVSASFNENNSRLTFDAPDQGSFALSDYVQSTLIGQTRFEEIAYLELRMPTNINSIDAIPLKDLDSGDTAPRLRLTLSGD